MYSSRVYKPIYTVKNLYNDFKILQDICGECSNTAEQAVYVINIHRKTGKSRKNLAILQSDS